MRVIQRYIDDIDEELEGAKNYAEKYVECKSKGNVGRASKFKEMANDELKHAMYVHEMAVADIEDLSKVFTAPEAMQEAWEKAHKGYVERVAWVRMMLNM